MSVVGIETLYEAPTFSGGHFYPPADNTYDLGSTDYSWRNLYVDTVVYAYEVGGDWKPSTTDSYNLGSTVLRWQHGYFCDDGYLFFGDGQDARLGFETADANAHALTLALPDGTADSVPVFVIGDQSVYNVDLTWFNGIVEPTVVVVNAAGDAYASLDSGDDTVAASKGLYFKAAADEDIEIINLSVTGTPRIYWDESGDVFRSTNGWHFDAGLTITPPLTIPEDSGAVKLVDMSVSAAPAAGTLESYTFEIDDNTVMEVWAHADSAGGLERRGVVFGGDVPSNAYRYWLGNNFVSGGGGTRAAMIEASGTLTGAAGDTTRLVGAEFLHNITTQNNTETIGVVSQVYISEPVITKGTDTVTVAASLYVANAPTEGATNAAIYVASGDVIIAGTGKLYFNDAGGEYISGDGSTLTITGAMETDAITAGGDVIVSDGYGMVIGHTSQLAMAAGDTPEFQILGTGYTDGGMGIAVFSSGTPVISKAPTIQFLKSAHATVGSNTIVRDGEILGAVRYLAADGGDFRTEGARMQAVINGTPAADDLPTELQFWTALGATADDIAKSATLNKSGAWILHKSVDSVAVADQVGISRYEIGAGDTVLALSQETAVVTETDETKVSHKVKVRWNGATYFVVLMDS